MSFPPEIFLMIPVFLLSLTVHEFSHALTAKWGGDMTATHEGRLTLNPLAHIDLVGTILIPIISALSRIPMFGWAKPVPVREENYQHPNWGVVVALAGPGSNFILALVTALILKILFWITKGNFPLVILTLGVLTIQINLMLTVFNLIPIPPLDGSHVLWHLVIKERSELYPLFEALNQFGMFALLILFWIPQTSGLLGKAVFFLARLIIQIFELPIL